jgi:putative transposase
MTQHIYRHRRRYKTTGHIWQGPYKDFIIQDEYHLMIVLRYIEANALRAGLTDSSSTWRWSSQFERSRGINYLLNRDVVKLPPNWLEIVDTPLSEEDATRLTRSLERQTPFGNDDWIQNTAEEHGLGHTIRPRGRPRNKK